MVQYIIRAARGRESNSNIRSWFRENSLSWFVIQAEFARATQVCAYDRAGLGWRDGNKINILLIRLQIIYIKYSTVAVSCFYTHGV